MRTDFSPAPPPVRPGPGLRLAQGVSYTINPIVLPPLTFALTMIHFKAPPREAAWLTAAAVLFYAVLPLVYVVHMVRMGRAGSLEVRERSARIRPMLVTIGSGIAGVFALAAVSEAGRPFILLAAATYVTNVALSLLVTRWWKISIHLIGLAGFLASGLFVASFGWPWPTGTAFALRWLYPAVLSVPLLMWARVRAGAHTPAQVFAGALGGFVVTTMELAVMTPIVLRGYGIVV